MITVILQARRRCCRNGAYGYVQSKEQYYTAKELLEIVRHYRKIGVPLDCVVQDWNTWDPGNWGEKILDQKRYGDMKECTEEIHKLNAIPWFPYGRI